MEREKKPTRLKHVEAITMLRGLAALGIAIFHVRIFLWTGWSTIQKTPGDYSVFDQLAAWLSLPAPLLGEGVLLFFVISGFCIHYPHAGNKVPLKIKQYTIRRFLRIYPPYAVAVGLSMLAVFFFPWGNIKGEAWLQSLLMVQNYLPHINSQVSSNCSLWSIPTEMEFYFAYPLLLILWRKWGALQTLTLLGTISLVAVGLYFQGLRGMAFCSCTFYILWWGGAYLAELYVSGRLGKPSTFTLILGIALLSTGTVALFQGEQLVMVQRFLFGGFFIILVWWILSSECIPSSNESRIARSLVRLGNISFSLYLIHYPFLQICGLVWVKIFGSKPNNFLIPLAFCGLTVVIASLFHFLVEKPTHHLARKLARNNA